MKKLIAILTIAIVLVGAVFATTGDKVTLQTSVAEIKPEFKIESTTQGAAIANSTAIDTQLDLSEEDIVWSFRLYQEGSLDKNNHVKTYSRYEGAITLSVEITAFSGTVGGATVTQATTYAITTATKGTDQSNRLTNGNPVIDQTNAHTVEFSLTYLGKKLNDSDATNVGTFTAKWDKDENLLMEDGQTDYTADIILTYTVQ